MSCGDNIARPSHSPMETLQQYELGIFGVGRRANIIVTGHNSRRRNNASRREVVVVWGPC